MGNCGMMIESRRWLGLKYSAHSCAQASSLLTTISLVLLLISEENFKKYVQIACTTSTLIDHYNMHKIPKRYEMVLLVHSELFAYEIKMYRTLSLYRAAQRVLYFC